VIIHEISHKFKAIDRLISIFIKYLHYFGKSLTLYLAYTHIITIKKYLMTRTITFAILSLLLSTLLSIPAHAEGLWHNGTMKGKTVAISPSKKVTLKIIKPKDGIWGHFIIPLSQEHTKQLKKYRINANYSFIPAYITIDGIERRSTGKVNQYQYFISIEVDRRQWDGLKKGSILKIELPDGTVFQEKLRGSMNALKKVERGLH